MSRRIEVHPTRSPPKDAHARLARHPTRPHRVPAPGCGTGQLAVAIERIGLAVTGIDADAEKLSHPHLGTERVDVGWIPADPRPLALPRRFGFMFVAAGLAAVAQ